MAKKQFDAADLFFTADTPAPKKTKPSVAEAHERKTKNVNFLVFLDDYEALQKIAYVRRTTATNLFRQELSRFIQANEAAISEYENIKASEKEN